METVNVAVISGNIAETAKVYRGDGISEFCEFIIINYRAVRVGDVKKKVREEIPVIMFSPGTIAKYLTKGKYVIVQGRVSPLGLDPHLAALSITFPGMKND